MKTEKRTRSVEYAVYITSDGKEFNTVREAKRHEVELLPERQIPKQFIFFDILDDNATCYKIESEEDLEYLVQKILNDNAYYTYDGPGWYIAFCHDGGDYPDNYDVFPVKYYLSQLESDVNKLKEVLDF